MNNILKQSQGQSPPIALSVPDRAWHTMTPNEVESHFGTDSSTGLDEATVQQRLAQFGPNRLAEAKQQTIWQVFLEEIREPADPALAGDRNTVLCVGKFRRRSRHLKRDSAAGRCGGVQRIPGQKSRRRTQYPLRTDCRCSSQWARCGDTRRGYCSRRSHSSSGRTTYPCRCTPSGELQPGGRRSLALRRVGASRERCTPAAP